MFLCWRLLGRDILDNSKADIFLEDLKVTLNHLVRRGKKVIVMEQAPVFDILLFNRYLRSHFALISYSDQKPLEENLIQSQQAMVETSNQTIEKLVLKIPGAFFIRPVSQFPGRKHLPFANGKLIYRDHGHLNEEGSKDLGRSFLKETSTLEALLNKYPRPFFPAEKRV